MASLFARKYSRWFSMKMRTRSSASLDSFSRSCNSVDDRPETYVSGSGKAGLPWTQNNGTDRPTTFRQRGKDRAWKRLHTLFHRRYAPHGAAIWTACGQIENPLPRHLLCRTPLATHKRFAGRAGFHILQSHKRLTYRTFVRIYIMTHGCLLGQFASSVWTAWDFQKSASYTGL